MTNFNPLNNFIFNQNLNLQKNLLQQQNSQTNSTAQSLSQTPAQIVNPNLAQNTQMFQTPNFLLNQNQFLNPELMFSFETLQMDKETTLKYLQGLLNLPNSIDKFINELNSQKLNPKALNVLVENMINLKELSALLNENSKEAVQKLMNTLALASRTTGGDSTQLKEVLSVLNSIQQSTSISSNSLKELLLLYIPINFQAFNEDVNFIGLSEAEKEKIKASTLSIMLETINFSNMLCIVNENTDGIYIELNADKDFSFEKFQKIVEVLSKEASIKSYLEFKPTKKEKIENSKQNFKVVSQGTISTNALILSHLITKTIFKIDSDFSI